MHTWTTNISFALPLQLEELEIDDCKMMEEIVRSDGQIEEDNEIVEFRKLTSLELTSLPALKSFCAKKRNMGSTTTETTSVHSLFDGTVTLTALRTLSVQRLDDIHTLFSEKAVFIALESLNIKEIWEEQDHVEESFCQLKSLRVEGCHKLKNVFPYAMLWNGIIASVENFCQYISRD